MVVTTRTEVLGAVLYHVESILSTLPEETLQDIKKAYTRVSNESEQNRFDHILREKFIEACEDIRMWDSSKQGTEWIEGENSEPD